MKRLIKLSTALLAALAVGLAAPAAAQEKLTVWFTKGFYKAEDDALDEAVKKFEQKTGVKVELSRYAVQDIIPKTVAALDAGNPPDVALRRRLRLPGHRASGRTTASSRTSRRSSCRSRTSSSRARSRPPSSTTTRPRRRPTTPSRSKQQTMHIQYWKDMLTEAGYKESDIPTHVESLLGLLVRQGAAGASRARRASAPTRSATRWVWIRATRSIRS